MKRNVTSILVIVGLLVASDIQAVPVDINTLYVDAGHVYLNRDLLTGISDLSGSTIFDPSIVITMGELQSTIFSIGDTNVLGLNVYSTNIAPTGFVDGNTIQVDLSGLRASLYQYGQLVADFGLWPFNTVQDYGSYDPLTSEYTAGWSEVFTIDLLGYGIDSTLDVELQGHLTTVPLPAALWLFSAGLISFAGFIKSKKIKV